MPIEKTVALNKAYEGLKEYFCDGMEASVIESSSEELLNGSEVSYDLDHPDFMGSLTLKRLKDGRITREIKITWPDIREGTKDVS